jgi:hypothetical protein
VDFVLELAPATGGGLGELRYGMTEDEAMTALDPWRQRPGPPGRAYRDSGLSIGPWFGGANHDRRSVVTGISFAGPPDKTDRVLFHDLDLWDGSLAEVVRQIRDHSRTTAQPVRSIKAAQSRKDPRVSRGALAGRCRPRLLCGRIA